MTTSSYALVLTSFVFLSGCWYATKTIEDRSSDKEASLMIQIDNLTVTDKTLTLDYQVSNRFADDIYVCQAATVFNSVKEAGTKLDGETLWITRGSKSDKSETDIVILADPPGISKYLRLRSGESHSDRIVLDLPIMIVNVADGVYSMSEERAKKRRQIVLHRAVLAVGYFAPKYNRFFVKASADGKKKLGIEDDDVSIVDPDFGLRLDPFVVDEMHEGKSRQVLYIGHDSPSQSLKESATVVITDVNIPCSVAVDG